MEHHYLLWFFVIVIVIFLLPGLIFGLLGGEGIDSVLSISFSFWKGASRRVAEEFVN